MSGVMAWYGAFIKVLSVSDELIEFYVLSSGSSASACRVHDVQLCEMYICQLSASVKRISRQKA
jgi:hypothetical protein